MSAYEDPEAVALLHRAVSMYPQDTLVNLAVLSHCRSASESALCRDQSQVRSRIAPDNAYSALFHLHPASGSEEIDAALEHLATAPRFESFWSLSVRRIDPVLQRLHEYPVVAESCDALLAQMRRDPDIDPSLLSDDCFHLSGANTATAATFWTTPAWFQIVNACREGELSIDGRAQRCREAMVRIQTEEQTSLMDDTIAIGILDALAQGADEKGVLAVQKAELRSLQQVLMPGAGELGAKERRFWELLINHEMGEAQALRVMQSQSAQLDQG